HQDMAMLIPEGISVQHAAAIPEVYLTAYQALFWLGNLSENQSVLIHAGASGVGTAAIQLAKSRKATVFVTATAGKHETCHQLGADAAFDYTTGSFEEWLTKMNSNQGVNIILDFIGSHYLAQ